MSLPSRRLRNEGASTARNNRAREVGTNRAHVVAYIRPDSRPLVLPGLLAFLLRPVRASKLNIEALSKSGPPHPEITAQAPGLSAEEMEREYTIPIEVGIAATPGVDVIRSTSFYGLSFGRATFTYGIDYYFALTQTAINLQQNVSLPNNVTPQIQATSLVGEIYRYQVVGPPHSG